MEEKEDGGEREGGRMDEKEVGNERESESEGMFRRGEGLGL